MFTVMVRFDASGKRSNLSPLGRRYSVMPSTAATLRIAETGMGGPSFTANAARCGSFDEGGDRVRAVLGDGASPFGAAGADSGAVPGGAAGALPGACGGWTGDALAGAA